MPYKDQTLDLDATVIRKLEEAGAVLCAKTSVGELAWEAGRTVMGVGNPVRGGTAVGCK